MTVELQEILTQKTQEAQSFTPFESECFDCTLQKLQNIFQKYSELDTPLFLKIKEGFVEKTAYFLSGLHKKPVSIGVAGESASGKSTIVFDMIECIEAFQNAHDFENIITRINTDDYYYDRSKEVKAAGGFDNFVKTYDLDSPSALELDLMCRHIQTLKKGHSVWLPKYDMSGSAKRYDHHTVANPGKIIISEGLFTLTEDLHEAFDFKIFVDIKEEVQKQRWYKRAEERGIKGSADEMYRNITQKSIKNVRPTKHHADVILNGEASRNEYKMFVVDILDVVETGFLNRV